MKKVKFILPGIFMVFIFTSKLNAQITNAEKESLKHMYEEEKLAYDVYSFLSDRYDLFVFQNISKSEKYHMSLVENLLKDFGIRYKVNPAGVFENEELQELYNRLIEDGSRDLISALTVGATIEDVDIYDLEKYIKEVENEEIKKVYEMLKCGSGNHMRAFSRQLKIHKTVYTPQFISQEKYQSILNSEHKRCFNQN